MAFTLFHLKNKRYQIEMSLYQKLVLELKSKFCIQYDDDFDFILRKIFKVCLCPNRPINIMSLFV